MAICAVMAALMCILGPMYIQIGPVPVTLISMVIHFMVYLLGTKKSLVSFLVYFLLGMAGMPVFSGFSGGMGKIAGPTGGYLIGFFVMILIEAAVIEKAKRNIWITYAAMFTATAADYAFGTAWFVFVTKSSITYALEVCVLCFIPLDIAKIAAAVYIGRVIYVRLRRSNIL